MRVHPSGWWLVPIDGEQHVMPADDLREHEPSPECWCHPIEDDETDDLWAHNSLDQRESFEEADRIQ